MMMLMMKKLGDQMSGLEKLFEDKIDMKFKVAEKSMMSKINEEVEEKLEVFKRRKNIIVYGIPEKYDRDEARRNESDTIHIRNLLIELKANVKNYDVTRIGKQTAH